MAVLAMDTATLVAAVAVGTDEQILASATSWVSRGHSKVLQPAIQSVLTTANLSARDLINIVVGVGPGSYTGVRLAVATAKAMAATLQISLTPVSTLLGMAEAAVPYPTGVEPVWALPMLYARRRRAFGALYRKIGSLWTTVVPEQVMEVDAWIETARVQRAQSDDPLVTVHDFEPRHKVLDVLPVTPGWTHVPLTEVAGGLAAGLIRVRRNQSLPGLSGDEIHSLVPNYALPVEAEAKLAERSANRHGHE
jgi:tRNA threonylcarbamoyladenosine biosynthesis protein TsaB